MSFPGGRARLLRALGHREASHAAVTHERVAVRFARKTQKADYSSPTCTGPRWRWWTSAVACARVLNEGAICRRARGNVAGMSVSRAGDLVATWKRPW